MKNFIKLLLTGVFSITAVSAAFLSSGCNITKINGNEDPYKGAPVYTLEEFNALEAIPEGTKTLVVDIDDITATEGSYFVIGNKNMADFHTSKKTADVTEEEQPYVIGTNGDISYMNTNKAGFTLVIKDGSYTAPKYSDPNQVNNNKTALCFYVPDATDIIIDNVTFTGSVAFSCQWQQIHAASYNPESVFPHTVKSLTLRKCIFSDGGIFQNGGFAKSLTIDECYFNGFDNGNNSNPIWFINSGSQDLGWYKGSACKLTIKNNTFKATRPIKVAEQSAENVIINIEYNTFEMSRLSTDTDDTKKNDAIIFSSTKGSLAGVSVKNNTVSGDVLALIAFASETCVNMAENASFKIIGNTLNSAKLSVLWKTDTAFIPDFAVLY